MKQKLESILNRGRILFLAGIAFLTIGCASIKPYVEPKVGAIIPVAAKEQDYVPSFLIGGACGVNIEQIGIEAGLDYFHSSAKYIETDSLIPRLNVSFNPFLQSKVKPYFLAGVNFLYELSEVDIPEFDVHDEMNSSTFGVDLGIGATLGLFDSRFTYTFLPGSGNAMGLVKLDAGLKVPIYKGNKK